MKKWAVIPALFLAILVSCSSQTDQYLDQTQPIVKQYENYAKTFDTYFQSAVTGDIQKATGQLERLKEMSRQIVDIEAEFTRIPLPVKLTSNPKLRQAKQARSIFFQTTTGFKNFLGQYQSAINKYSELMELYAGLQAYLGPKDERKKLKGDKLEETFVKFQGYQVQLQEWDRKLTKRLQRCESEAVRISENQKTFNELTAPLYGIEVFDVAKVDMTPFNEARIEWEKGFLEPILSIKDQETFQKAYPRLALTEEEADPVELLQ